ncbi:MAG: twitching motility protein PilT, partial [Gammaproteobacteria bacterium]|nr:twitching motility protein PilT [Gammaproteobacteria bacterium]
RDRRLLFMKCITHGYWVRSVIADRQLEEVLDRFDLRPQIHPFQRCIVCNGMLEEVAKAEVFERLEPRTRLYYDRFHRCRGCGKIYWEGSHVEDMRQRYLRACVEAEQAGAPP